MMTTRRISSHQGMESCHIGDDDTRSRDDNEPKLAVANPTLLPSFRSDSSHLKRMKRSIVLAMLPTLALGCRSTRQAEWGAEVHGTFSQTFPECGNSNV